MNQSLSAANASLTVLVVDDEPGIPEVISAMLSSGGHRVTTAIDGVHALILARASRYELIISDYKMPRMHGGELFAALRSELKHPFWFILMSVVSEREARALCPEVHAFLQKPFQLAELLNVVKTGGDTLRLAAN